MISWMGKEILGNYDKFLSETNVNNYYNFIHELI